MKEKSSASELPEGYYVFKTNRGVFATGKKGAEMFFEMLEKAFRDSLTPEYLAKVEHQRGTRYDVSRCGELKFEYPLTPDQCYKDDHIPRISSEDSRENRIPRRAGNQSNQAQVPVDKGETYHS